MITIQLTQKQMDVMAANMGYAMLILDGEPAGAERDLAKAYADLVKAVTHGILAEGQMVMVGREERLGDTLDRPEMHNINIANRPSDMQLKAYEEEHKDGKKV